MKNYYAIPYISNSTLTWFKVSPLYCWRRMNREILDEEKSYTHLGKQLHLSLLEPEEFEKCYIYLDFKTPASKQQLGFCEAFVKHYGFVKTDPFTFLAKDDALLFAYKENYVTDKMTSEAILKLATKLYESNKDYIEYLVKKGDYREVLSKSKQELITTITQSIKSHKKANRLMFLEDKGEAEAFNEHAIYWEYPIYNGMGEGIKCKSLLDRLVVDHKNKKIFIVDLKTSSILGDSADLIEDRNYYRQLAFYRLAVQNCPTLPKNYEIESYIVTVNTQDPFECRVYKMSEQEYQKQLIEINNLMMQISWHWFTNQWDYSRTYYEGDGTENHINEYCSKSIEGDQYDGFSTIRVADVI